MADGKTRLMEFRARELSHRRLFLAADDLGLLDVGEEVELLIAAPGERLSSGRARVLGSERVFGQPASGYRLAWTAPDARLRAVIDGCLGTVDGGGLPETGLEPARSCKTKGF